MATLVLTAVGTALGGPIGGALGAFIGQQVDQNLLFKPDGREGPRLQELAVQTSSYGTQVPRIYGAMRVAGTVIWATDLKETRNTDSGSKGRPSTTSFSYSTSLAVALSSRQIKNIGRIWADGKIFRGSAGDFKTPTGFRFYPGSDDQPVDGLIAAAEAEGQTPAHRGLAIAVFEDMELADYGNRIPSLSFEVIADDGNISVANIMHDISDNMVTSAHHQSLHGFSAAGPDRRTALESITDNFPSSFTAGPNTISVRPRIYDNTQPILIVDDDSLGRTDGEVARKPEFQVVPETRVPRQLSLRYYDPDRDYQSGMQNAFRTGKSRAILNQDFPAALVANSAKAIVQDKLWSDYQERNTARLHILLSDGTVRPGSLIQVEDSAAIWRVRSWELKNGTIELSISKASDLWSDQASETDEGRSVQELDALAGGTRLVLADLPFAIDAPTQVADQSQLYAVAAGDAGWRSAQLFKVDDVAFANEPIGRITMSGTIGTGSLLSTAVRPFVIDRKTRVQVELHNENMEVFSVSSLE